MRIAAEWSFIIVAALVVSTAVGMLVCHCLHFVSSDSAADRPPGYRTLTIDDRRALGATHHGHDEIAASAAASRARRSNFSNKRGAA